MQRYNVVSGSLKLEKGERFQDELKFSLTVEDPSVTSQLEVKGYTQLQKVTIIVDRNAGPYSWAAKMKVQIEKPSFSVQRNVKNWVSRLTDLPGAREIVLAEAQKLWDSFKPTEEEIAQMQSGAIDRKFTARIPAHYGGDQVAFEVKSLSYSGMNFDGEFNVRIDGEYPGKEGEDFKVVLAETNTPLVWRDFMDDICRPRVSKSYSTEVFTYLKPAILRKIESIRKDIMAERLAKKRKSVEWDERQVEQHRAQHIEAQKNLKESMSALAAYEQKVKAWNR